MRHSEESNFTFIKGLSSSIILGQSKLKDRELIFEKEINSFFRTIYYKQAADEYKVGFVKSGRLFLSEYKNGILTETLKIEKK